MNSFSEQDLHCSFVLFVDQTEGMKIYFKNSGGLKIQSLCLHFEVLQNIILTNQPPIQ